MDLILDLGQSGARVKIGNELIPYSKAKSTNDSLLKTLEIIFQEIPNGEYENAFLSLTGVNGKVMIHEEIADLCSKFFKTKHVAVMDDGFAAFIGALRDRNGVVLTLGSGVVAVSGNKGMFAHTDGKGSIFGDYGSGFWLGQQAMRRAVGTIDGRDNAHEFVEILRAEIAQLNALDNKVGAEATLLCIKAAKTVAEGADQGITAAMEILENGAQHLATTIQTAWNKVKSSNQETPFIVITGGLTQSDTYVKLIKEKSNLVLACNFIEAEADHLVGAHAAAEIFPKGVDPLFKWAHRN